MSPLRTGRFNVKKYMFFYIFVCGVNVLVNFLCVMKMFDFGTFLKQFMGIFLFELLSFRCGFA